MFDAQTSALAHRSLSTLRSNATEDGWRRWVAAQNWGCLAPSARHPCRTGPEIESSSVRCGIFWNDQMMSFLTELSIITRKTTYMPALTGFASPRLRVNQAFKIKNLQARPSEKTSSPIKPNQGFIDEKNSEFFSGHFYRKSLANLQKMPQKHVNLSQKTCNL